ncbi:MAG: MBL fold metallo-hydrolase [Actinobacteria bacterium]|nr:MBL fold metallo-hydrolase [Actinomycetota bacterium]
MLEGFTWFKQSALRWAADGPIVYIDPWGVGPDDTPADLILITHAHADHFQPEEIAKVTKEGTKLVAPHDVAAELTGHVTSVAPGESHEVAGIRFTTVPAYNVVEERLEKHPKANGWVGFVLELGPHRTYHAGDTDHVPELESIKADVAFLPIGGTFTMDVPEAAGLARAMAPGVAVPMHYGFVVGEPADAERFRQAAAPVPVEVLIPVRPFGED